MGIASASTPPSGGPLQRQILRLQRQTSGLRRRGHGLRHSSRDCATEPQVCDTPAAVGEAQDQRCAKQTADCIL